MNFEVLKRSNLKRNIIIGVVVVAIITAVVITFSRASYKSVAKVDLVDGVINYSLADFNVIAIYVGGEPQDNIPTDGNYSLTSESYCTVNNEEDNSINLSYDMDTKTLTVSPVTTKGTKCYLYFEEVEAGIGKEYILTYATMGSGTPNFANTSCTNGTNDGGDCDEETVGLYEMEVNNAITYYFRGDVEDNYVLFAGYYWRIIRINEDGSIRLIYQGSSPTDTGQIGTSAFNDVDYGEQWSYYVGYTYTVNSQRGTASDSTIKTRLEYWYTTESRLPSYDSYITEDAGFCNDRTTYNSDGSTKTWTGTDDYYGAFIRLYLNKTPSLECNTEDLYKTKVGLITADEVAMAGGVYYTNNTSYYLYTGNSFWTMSPSFAYSRGYAYVFRVASSGYLNDHGVSYSNGVRPVINLRADVTLTGKGTSSVPFEVIG